MRQEKEAIVTMLSTIVAVIAVLWMVHALMTLPGLP
jgi:hypothetical protein